jgi:hypothetical protein
MDDFDTILERERRRNPMKRPIFTPQRTAEGWERNRTEYLKLRDREGIFFDPRFKPEEYEILTYVAGGHNMKSKWLTFKHFDSVAYICRSQHPITREERHHFTGSRDGVITILNCRKIK